MSWGSWTRAPGDGDTLHHAAAEGFHRVVARSARADDFKKPLRTGDGFFDAVEAAEELEVLAGGEVAIQHGLVANESDACTE